MIKAVAATSDGTVVILGLSRENCKRLVAGQPIPVKLAELDPRLPELTILLMGGETEETMAAELGKHLS